MLGRSPFLLGRDIEQIHRRLERIEQKLDLVLRHLSLVEAGTARPEPSSQVVALLRSGHRLQAIKAYSEESGLTKEQAELAMEVISISDGPQGQAPVERNAP